MRSGLAAACFFLAMAAPAAAQEDCNAPAADVTSFTGLPGSLTIWNNFGTNVYNVTVTADSKLSPTDVQSTRTISTVVTAQGTRQQRA